MDIINNIFANYSILIIIIVGLIVLALIGYLSDKKKRIARASLGMPQDEQQIENIKKSLESAGSVSLTQVINKSGNLNNDEKLEKPGTKTEINNSEVL